MNNKQEAKTLMREILNQKLAACSNIFETVSMYEWKGELVEEIEYKVVFKTSYKHADNLFAYIKNNHSYEIPYIVQQKARANGDYVRWLNERTSISNK